MPGAVLLLADGVSKLLLADGTSNLLLAEQRSLPAPPRTRRPDMKHRIRR